MDQNQLNIELNLFRLVFAGFISISLYPSHHCMELTEKPFTTELIRYQAQHQNYVTNFYHKAIGLHPIDKHILPMLDGEHSIEQLSQLIENAIHEHKIAFSNQKKEPITNKETIKQESLKLCKNRLQFILNNALLSIEKGE